VLSEAAQKAAFKLFRNLLKYYYASSDISPPPSPQKNLKQHTVSTLRKPITRVRLFKKTSYF
jgi:hypothetical protein